MKWEDYFEPGTNDVLKNNLGIKNKDELQKTESYITNQVIKSILKRDDKIQATYQSYQNLHKEIFSKIYPNIIAGATRQIDMTKGEPLLDMNSVAYARPNMIESYAAIQIERLNKVVFQKADKVSQNIAVSEFVDASVELWVAHPFREGNTRTHAVFITKLAAQKGYPLDYEYLNKNQDYRDALVLAYNGNKENLEKIIKQANLIASKENVSNISKRKTYDQIRAELTKQSAPKRTNSKRQSNDKSQSIKQNKTPKR